MVTRWQSSTPINLYLTWFALLPSVSSQIALIDPRTPQLSISLTMNIVRLNLVTPTNCLLAGATCLKLAVNWHENIPRTHSQRHALSVVSWFHKPYSSLEIELLYTVSSPLTFAVHMHGITP